MAVLPVPALLEQVARSRPGAPALITSERVVTFAELSTRAAGLSRFLRERGAGPGRLVLLNAEPSPESVIAIFAVLRAGAGYVVVEPGMPAPWVESVIARTRPAVMVAVDPRDDAGPRWLRLPEAGEYEGAPAYLSDDPESVMYVVFTSGSTGPPKGVVTSHRACLARQRHFWRAYPHAPDERACLSATLTTSDSIRQIFESLLVGTPVVIPPRGSRRDPLRLARELAAHRVTRVLLTPSLLRVLLSLTDDPAAELGGVRHWFLSGEPLAAGLLRRARALLPGARFTNLYATTEAAATFADVPGDDGRITVGRPPPGAEVLLLDSGRRPVPAGEPGEVFFGGHALASGYLDDAEATRAAFVPHPTRAGARLYRTGDLGRLLDDGSLELLGRIDGQVQVRGYRVEPQAVEQALADHPAIAQAAVTLRMMPEGRQGLVAFCVPATGTRPEPAGVLAHVRGLLPEHMVPSRCHLVDRLPLTRTGKLDRHRLRSLQGETRSPQTDDGGGSGVERRVRAEWARALGCVPGWEDDLFTRGADSLIVASVVGRLRRDGLDVTVPDVFATPTVRGVARLAQGRPATREPSGPGDDSAGARLVALAPWLRGIWFDALLDPDSSAYNVVKGFEIAGPLDEAALRASVAHLVARHDALRTCFPVPDGDPRQETCPEPRVEWLPPDDPDRILRELTGRPFDVERGPLVRAALTPAGGGRHLFAVSMHHLVCDDVSLQVFFEELAACYRAFRAGTVPELPALTCGFADVVRQWQPDEGLAAYWASALAGLPGDVLEPLDEQAPVTRHDLRVGPRELSVLTARLRSEGHTLPQVVLTAFAAALGECTGRREVVVAVPMAGRQLPETERVIGCLVNVVPVRVRLDGDPGQDELLHRVRTALIDAYAHQALPVGEIAAAAGHPGRVPWDACLNVTPGLAPCPDLEGVSVTPVEPPALPLIYPIDLGVVQDRDGLAVRLRTGRDDGAGLAALLERGLAHWTAAKEPAS